MLQRLTAAAIKPLRARMMGTCKHMQLPLPKKYDLLFCSSLLPCEFLCFVFCVANHMFFPHNELHRFDFVFFFVCLFGGKQAVAVLITMLFALASSRFSHGIRRSSRFLSRQSIFFFSPKNVMLN
jgi:hypothetical protein